MTTMYVQNMSPHQILKNMTPTRVKPEVGVIHKFGHGDDVMVMI
jgi:hypothetical protein